MSDINCKVVYLLCLLGFFYSCRSQKQVKGTMALINKEPTRNYHPDSANILDNTNYKPPTIPVRKINSAIFGKTNAYEIAFKELKGMLEGNARPDFKRAVFVTENAWYNNSVSYETYNGSIQKLGRYCKAWMKANKKLNYHEPDSLNYLKNVAIYKVLKDTIFYWNDQLGRFPIKMVAHEPFTYDFNDFFGKNSWSRMFVGKLLDTGSGNCHSMPYLYKILADELDAKAWLGMAPSHLYIKNRSKELGWYNTELTSGVFPNDAWITASGYISLEAIRNGVFMDTLSQKQCIGLCLYDLAKGYEMQTQNYSDGFIIKCCELVLKHQPNQVKATILKAESLKKKFEALMKKQGATKPAQIMADKSAAGLYEEMQGLYVKTLETGYREMPVQMYIDWLKSIEQEKFINQKIISTFKYTSGK